MGVYCCGVCVYGVHKKTLSEIFTRKRRWECFLTMQNMSHVETYLSKVEILNGWQLETYILTLTFERHDKSFGWAKLSLTLMLVWHGHTMTLLCWTRLHELLLGSTWTNQLGQVESPLECPFDIVIQYSMALLLLSVYKGLDFVAIEWLRICNLISSLICECWQGPQWLLRGQRITIPAILTIQFVFPHLKTSVMGKGRKGFEKLKDINTTDYKNPQIWSVGD